MGWQFWIDRGGTFTDIVARTPEGEIRTDKLLSENPLRYDDAAVESMRKMLGLGEHDSFPAEQVDAIKMGMTVATNALLERKGEPTLLAITRGFAEALFIGNQDRPQLFDLNIQRPELLHSYTVEIEERILADGSVDTPLNETAVRQHLEDAFERGYRSIAIVLLHADRFPDHEEKVAEIAKAVGYEQISASHDVISLIKLIGRGDTTVADAYLSPILRRYVQMVQSHVSDTNLLFMQSNGGLTDAHLFRGKDAILSGPAGGVVGMAGVAARAGLDRIIGFDMGGTSTDVSHFNGRFERGLESKIAGVRIRAPMMQIHTVAAGGGSMCLFDGLRFRVGPESAGAEPGPAAYRRGGPLTITDCNVHLGRIDPRYFPHVFGPKGDEPLDDVAVTESFAKLADTVKQALNKTFTTAELAEGFLALAVENMANAIKTISVQRGYDITDYALVCFGGAGGQHACRVADALAMTKILIHPLAGVLSAYGMGLADLRVIRERTVAQPLTSESLGKIRETLDALSEDAVTTLIHQGLEDADISTEKRVYVRYEGSDTGLSVKAGSVQHMMEAFQAEHLRLFGFLQEDTRLIADAAEVEASGGGAPIDDTSRKKSIASASPQPLDRITMVIQGRERITPVFDRNALAPGHHVEGPALIIEANATTVVEPEWRADITPHNNLLLSRLVVRQSLQNLEEEADPVRIEIFNNLFMNIAEQMGAVLQNTAHSVNIKERLDFSCAVFDPVGGLVANAPHMPVHLGSMGESVRAVLNRHGDTMKPGDAYVTNAPYNGGTHLPDITVIAPVYDQDSNERLFFVAARGHHADIGGITPGSMPPHSRIIDEEGVLLDTLPLVREERFLEDELRQHLTSGPHPARNVDQSVADLKAQMAACTKGTAELFKMVQQYGVIGVKAYTQHVQDNAEEAVRRVIDTLSDGSFTAPLDDGSEIKVTVTVDKKTRSANVDFTGTSEQRPNNFNAPSAICRAAVLYVFRTLVEDDIPMNEGCLKPLQLTIPEGSMLNPIAPAAVVAGNVETSQIICDALYGALGRLAASQGTMNNLTFGDETLQYYETICGGGGAGAAFDGAGAIHTHMTNSRLTDPEILEWRYPVIIERFGIRADSGGNGRHRGGDGVVRQIRFRAPMTVSILSGRRLTRPFGLMGGEDGQAGRTWITRKDSTEIELSFADTRDVAEGDTVTVATPGGGGFGPPQSNDGNHS